MLLPVPSNTYSYNLNGYLLYKYAPPCTFKYIQLVGIQQEYSSYLNLRGFWYVAYAPLNIRVNSTKKDRS
jgi:hypothetical protein